ncbi:MAG: hypothetical protein ACFNOJ_00965, partial [Prevotella nigrescens]
MRKVDTFYRLFRHVCVPLHAENPIRAVYACCRENRRQISEVITHQCDLTCRICKTFLRCGNR